VDHLAAWAAEAAHLAAWAEAVRPVAHLAVWAVLLVVPTVDHQAAHPEEWATT